MPELLCLETADEGETDLAAKKIFSLLTSNPPHEVILLTGDLGAGKTTLARQLLRLWGVEGPITSPTFNLIHVFPVGNLRILHADLYRLEKGEELNDLGIWDDLGNSGPALIEWGEGFPSLKQRATLEIHLEITSPTGRRIRVYRT